MLKRQTIVKTVNDGHTTKFRTGVILLSNNWRILGGNELVDFLHIQ
jgi:hypothetical protein